MDPRLLGYYNRELEHLRQVGGEFAAEFPKIAGRLGLDAFECTDPYVERLLEGFAFLAARVQLKLDAEFPRLTQHLLEMVYPHYLAPTPSVAIVQLQPDLTEGSLAEGFEVPRDSALRGLLGKGEQTRCEFRTAHDVTLWPIEIAGVESFGRDAAVPFAVPNVDAEAGLRFRLRATAGLKFEVLPLDRLPVLLRGGPRWRLYERLMTDVAAVAVRPFGSDAPFELLRPDSVRPWGFEDDQALFPYGPQSFRGYRLLQEYFALPDRFLFFELTGLQRAVRRCKGNELEIQVLFRSAERTREPVVSPAEFALHCTPAVNLFPKRADRIHLTDGAHEHHVVVDRTRPMDFEVYAITAATGIGIASTDETKFLPFYAANQDAGDEEHAAYYTVRREPRVLSSKQHALGSRTGYIGSEMFVSLVDAAEPPYRHDLRQLALETLCTNRDLPLQMPIGVGDTDLSLDIGAPVRSIRCVAGPTRPKPSLANRDGETAWRLVSHLSLNYLSLTDTDARRGAASLREMLGLYGDAAEAVVRKEIGGVRSVSSRPTIRPVPIPGPIAFGRGLEVTLHCDEAAFEGSGCFVLASVLEQFFAGYASINSFTEMVLTTSARGEVYRWPPRIGRRETL